MERRFRRDGEDTYPQWGESAFNLEVEFAQLTRDLDRLDVAMLNAQRYVRPVDIARHHRWDEREILEAAYGSYKNSDKYGNRIK